MYRIIRESHNGTGTDGALATCMKHYTLHIILVETSQVKVYVNEGNSQAIVFPSFGRYYRVSSDTNALDLATSLLFHVTHNITYNSYINSLEDTAVIELDKVG